MRTKYCSKCGRTRTISSFRVRKDRPCGTTAWCQDCLKTYQKEKNQSYYKDPIKKEALLRRNRESHDRQLEERHTWVVQYLRQHPCVDCGENDPVVLDFDHIRKKKMDICKMLHGGFGLDKIKAEIKKCVVRCSNCYRRKTAKEGNHRRHRILGAEQP